MYKRMKDALTGFDMHQIYGYFKLRNPLKKVKQKYAYACAFVLFLLLVLLSRRESQPVI